MINGYSNPYDILSNPESPFLREVRRGYANNLVEKGENASEEMILKALHHFMGTGLISSFYKWTGSYLIKDYYKRCIMYIEEEYNLISSSTELLEEELRMSFLIFAITSKWLDIVEYQSTELHNSVKIVWSTIKHFSLTKALEESLEDDLRTGKLSKWYDFAMTSYMCLLSHCWQGIPSRRDSIILFAQYANKTCIEGANTIDSLFRFNFDASFLSRTVLDYCRYQLIDIQKYGESTVRYDLVHGLLKCMPRIIEEVGS